jgi:hypothetical protein
MQLSTFGSSLILGLFAHRDTLSILIEQNGYFSMIYKIGREQYKSKASLES